MLAAIEYDPFSHELHEDPYPLYRELLEHHPVLHNPALGFWSVARYDDVESALTQPQLFSSKGVGLGADGEPVAERMPMMILMDPPRHDELRTLVNRAFTPRRVAQLEERIRSIARGLVEDFIDAERCELFADFAAPLPTTVIAELLGVPVEDHEMFKERSTAVVAASGPSRDTSARDAASAGAELLAYLGEQFARKRADPGDDLMSALLEAEIDGRRLTDLELVSFGMLLLIAGNETTTNLISNATSLLDRYADQRALLLEQPQLIPAAIEEFLRFDSPVQGIERLVTDDVTIAGQPIPSGDKVFLVLAAANRDPRRIEDPDRFDIRRSPNRHLAFGFGAHFCLGAGLARLEARVAWEELAARISDFGICAPVERLHSGVIRGLLRVPLEFRRR